MSFCQTLFGGLGIKSWCKYERKIKEIKLIRGSGDALMILTHAGLLLLYFL
jgi:hypothetical protein